MSKLLQYLLHKPEVKRLFEERMKALQAVRKHVDGGISERLRNRIGAGSTAEAFAAPGTGKVVKKMRDLGKPFPDETTSMTAMHELQKEMAMKELRRRGHLKSIAADAGAAPETFLVDTSKNRYLVQDELNPVSWYASDRKGGGVDQVYDKLKKAGISGSDIKMANIGQTDVTGDYQALDLGMNRAMRPVSESERQRALSRFIQKNRKKEWAK